MQNFTLLVFVLMCIGFSHTPPAGPTKNVKKHISSSEYIDIDDCAALPIVKLEDDCETNLVHYGQEYHLSNVRQLTFGGDNAEAYFSFNDHKLVFQYANEKAGIPCDQIYYGDIPKSDADVFTPKLLSTGTGKTTCSYFLPGDQAIVYASTHEVGGPQCPPKPNWRSVGKYVWPIHSSFEIYYADLHGNITKRLTKNNYYDAEATVSPDGNKIVFTSNRSGDLELYVMDIFGGNIQQITTELGYDGGAFFSRDSKQIVFRASRPRTPEKVQEYRQLMAQGLVAPSDMELFVCNTNGSNLRQVTNLGGANWAPFFHPSGEKIVFCSNHRSPKGFPFNIFVINTDGSNLEQVTFDDSFDSFPMFSYDGTKLVFASNRNNGGTRDTNLFLADWIE